MRQSTNEPLYIAPRADLNADELLIYKDIFGSLCDSDKVKISHQNLCVMYARTMNHVNQLQAELQATGYTAIGSQGQLSAHPVAKMLVTFQTQLVAINRAMGMVSNEDNRQKGRNKEREDARRVAADAGKTGLLALPRRVA